MADKRADTLLQTMRFIEWFTLNRAWDGLSDDEPGPITSGAAIVAATLNEVSHHGTQICLLRDLYRATGGHSFG